MTTRKIKKLMQQEKDICLQINKLTQELRAVQRDLLLARVKEVTNEEVDIAVVTG